ncbi:ABC transporter permease [Ascidiimonas aurantiaca]|uniref:ABC transporter permease n=1 Tax=Ascidiimonas aurantiaca TaxID=1685432 RepID=UPI0030EF23F6
MKKTKENWLFEITPRRGLLDFNLREIWQYRDLLWLFVKRDIVTVYKQTILGPLWFFIQPIMTTIVFLVVFGKIANIPTDGVPPILFYLSGIVAWNYFAECLNLTSDTFKKNEAIFSKVYFPRIVLPLSIVISNLGKFLIQLFLFLATLGYFVFFTETSAKPNKLLILFPVLVLLMGLLGLSAGMIISSLTTKYRDLTFLVKFGVSLLMYATPVVYPLSQINTQYRWIAELNPLTPLFEIFKYSFLGQGTFTWGSFIYSCIFSIVVLLIGILTFNRTEKSFIDTI